MVCEKITRLCTGRAAESFTKRIGKFAPAAKTEKEEQMFIQVVEWLTKFVGLLNDAGKVGGARNRKELAATLVQLYTLMFRTADNAERIHNELQRVRRDIGGKHGAFFESLDMLLGDHRQILKELQDIVRDNHKALINIYGNNISDEIAYIASIKVSLIDVITTFALYKADNFWWYRRYENWIPRSFDLMDVPEFKDLFERLEERSRWFKESRKNNVEEREYFESDLGLDDDGEESEEGEDFEFDLDLDDKDAGEESEEGGEFDIEIPVSESFAEGKDVNEQDCLRSYQHDFQWLFDLSFFGHSPDKLTHCLFAVKAGKSKKQDSETVDNLLAQARSFDSPRRLREARDIIGGILREHFKIEEVF